MPVSRRRLLQQRSNALKALANPDLPQPIKVLAKKAADHAGVALGLMDAKQRKVADGRLKLRQN